jgi:hypothetical protein
MTTPTLEDGTPETRCRQRREFFRQATGPVRAAFTASNLC